MLDLIHLVQEGEGAGAVDSTSGNSRPPDDRREHLKALAKNVKAQEQYANAAINAPGSKGSSGLFAKYKNMKARRRSNGSDQGDDKHTSIDDANLLDYSPLSKGEPGAGRVDLEATASPISDQDVNESSAMDPQNNSFMGKVRAYRNKQKARSSSRGSDGMDEGGPLQQGLTNKSQPHKGKGQTSDGNQNAGMREFFDRVAEAKALLAKITERQRDITAARVKTRTLVSSSEVQTAQAQIQEDIDEVTTICKKVKAKLLELDIINGGLLSDNQDEEDLADHPELQMRLSVMAGLNAKLSEVTLGWQKMRSQWQDEDREEVAHQLHTVTGQHFEPEQVDELVQSGGTEQIYRQALGNISGATVQQLMSDVQQRHDQMRQLEVSMLELHQVFLDMSILVADQGDTINNIDNWVCSTAFTMQESLRQLRAAKESRRKAATTKAVTFVTGVGLVAGGAGLTATGVGAVAGIPMMVAGAAAVGGSAIGGIT